MSKPISPNSVNSQSTVESPNSGVSPTPRTPHNPKLVIGYFYQKQLNLYGDNGNVEILVARAKARGFDTEVLTIDTTTTPSADILAKINLVFMGGGPDAGQKLVYQDLIQNKGAYLKDYIQSGGVGLYICGSYQLLGNYYKSADGAKLQGLGAFDLYTEHFGPTKPRCIGNTLVKLNTALLEDTVFNAVNTLGETLVGFENHGGRTYLGKNILPLGFVSKGYGNNGVDTTEGVYYKNSIGTYLHGPILSRNAHLADYLIAKSLGLTTLARLDDTLIISAYTASKTLRQ